MWLCGLGVLDTFWTRAGDKGIILSMEPHCVPLRSFGTENIFNSQFTKKQRC